LAKADDGAQRLDAWLYRTRFFKTRAFASAIASKGRLRINGERIHKASRLIRPGDILTFPQGNAIRVVRMLAPAERRGSASEAQTHYEAVVDKPNLNNPDG